MEFKHDQTRSSSSESAFDSSKTPAPEKKESMFMEMLRFSILALIIVVPIRLFIAQPFIVSGASMEHTFSSGEYLIVDQLSYRFEEPQRGDVIIFRYPKNPSQFFIKRIIGLPGDTIAISDHTVTITNAEYPEGATLDEDYILDVKSLGNRTETLGDDEYFVMGDNRDASSDSRIWGVLTRDHIVGRAFLRLFPVTTIGVLPGAEDIKTEPVSKESATL